MNDSIFVQTSLELFVISLLCHTTTAIQSSAQEGNAIFSPAKVIFRHQELLSIADGFGLNRIICSDYMSFSI